MPSAPSNALLALVAACRRLRLSLITCLSLVGVCVFAFALAACVSQREHTHTLAELERDRNARDSATASELRLRREVKRLQKELASANERVTAYRSNADAALLQDLAAQEAALRDFQDSSEQIMTQCRGIQTKEAQCARLNAGLRTELAKARQERQPCVAVVSAPSPRPAPVPVPTTGERWHVVEAAANDEVFVINGEVFKARTYCFNVHEGDRVLFVEGSALGACASAKFVVQRTGNVCAVWCE